MNRTQKIKVLIGSHIDNSPTGNFLRSMIYSDHNVINWEFALEVFIKQHPEVLNTVDPELLPEAVAV